VDEKRGELKTWSGMLKMWVGVGSMIAVVGLVFVTACGNSWATDYKDALLKWDQHLVAFSQEVKDSSGPSEKSITEYDGLVSELKAIKPPAQVSTQHEALISAMEPGREALVTYVQMLGDFFGMDITALRGALDTWNATVASIEKARTNIGQVIDE